MVYGAGASAAILGGIAGGGEPAAEEPMGPGEPERKEEVAPEIKEEAAPERRQEAADSKKKAAKTTAAGGAGVDYKLAAKPSPPEANPVEGSLVPLSVLQAEKALQHTPRTSHSLHRHLPPLTHPKSRQLRPPPLRLSAGARAKPRSVPRRQSSPWRAKQHWSRRPRRHERPGNGTFCRSVRTARGAMAL